MYGGRLLVKNTVNDLCTVPVKLNECLILPRDVFTVHYKFKRFHLQ